MRPRSGSDWPFGSHSRSRALKHPPQRLADAATDGTLEGRPSHGLTGLERPERPAEGGIIKGRGAELGGDRSGDAVLLGKEIRDTVPCSSWRSPLSHSREPRRGGRARGRSAHARRRDSRRTPSTRQFRKKLLEGDRLQSYNELASRAEGNDDPARAPGRAAGERRHATQQPPVHPSACLDPGPPYLTPDLEHEIHFGRASSAVLKERGLGPAVSHSPVQLTGDQLEQDAPFVREWHAQRMAEHGIPQPDDAEE